MMAIPTQGLTAGGYDSGDEEDGEELHLGSCPCCLLKSMPVHRAVHESGSGR